MGMTWPKKSKIVDSTKILSVNSLESDPAYRIATTAPETLPIAKVPSFHKLSRTSSNVIHFSGLIFLFYYETINERKLFAKIELFSTRNYIIKQVLYDWNTLHLSLFKLKSN